MNIFNKIFFGFALLTSAQTLKAKTLYKIEINDAIHIGTFEHINRALNKTNESDEAAGLLIVLDTPGGYLNATRDIVKLMLQSETPIAVWVKPAGAHAASAGAMITMAAHYAVMAPSTSIGAATPINAGGKDIGKDLKAKITNDTLAFVEGIARKRNRNITAAKDFVSKATSFSATDALKENVVDAIIENEAVLTTRLKEEWKIEEELKIVSIDLNLRENVLSFFANPNIAYALLGLGALGIYVEMTNPGLIFPGAIGAISLALGALTTKIIPINAGALVLLALAIVFFAIEIFVPMATFGVAGIAGLVSLFLSGALLLDPSQTNLKLDAVIWLPTFFVISGFMILLGYTSIKALRSKPYKQGINALESKDGRITQVMGKGKYKVFVQGETWNAISESQLNKDQDIVVIKQKGFTLSVEPKEKKNV